MKFVKYVIINVLIVKMLTNVHLVLNLESMHQFVVAQKDNMITEPQLVKSVLKIVPLVKIPIQIVSDVKLQEFK